MFFFLFIAVYTLIVLLIFWPSLVTFGFCYFAFACFSIWFCLLLTSVSTCSDYSPAWKIPFADTCVFKSLMTELFSYNMEEAVELTSATSITTSLESMAAIQGCLLWEHHLWFAEVQRCLAQLSTASRCNSASSLVAGMSLYWKMQIVGASKLMLLQRWPVQFQKDLWTLSLSLLSNLISYCKAIFTILPFDLWNGSWQRSLCRRHAHSSVAREWHFEENQCLYCVDSTPASVPHGII